MHRVNTKQNPNCDHSFCRHADGEVRLVPVGGDGNMILCKDCFTREMRNRKEFNREQGEKVWDIPKWDDLTVYDVS